MSDDDSRPGGGGGSAGSDSAGSDSARSDSDSGLRERKKRQRYQDISDAAIALFLDKGFDAVSVAEVAAAAEISKPTLFRYFPTKEDLALHRFADHEDEAARVVRGRPDGVRPLDALCRHFVDGLDRRDPVTGLTDDDTLYAYLRLLYGTPSLVARLHEYTRRSEEALAAALGGGIEGVLGAGQVLVVQRILAEENWRRIQEGASAAEVYPVAVAQAELAFGRLRTGLSAW
ncbi:TetR family transcriptional regulator [Streptomyces sp. NPDC093109]|uniref:TetR/AcrR family transcriptional regulator n=1 Tax=Streptomyces sp. NPDC093109 TaxID=3154977 RepID=UPI00344C0F19